MSSFNSWEDDPAAHEDSEKQNQNAPRGLRAGAASFTPSAAAPSFTPSVPYPNQQNFAPTAQYYQPYNNTYGDNSSQLQYQSQYQSRFPLPACRFLLLPTRIPCESRACKSLELPSESLITSSRLSTPTTTNTSTRWRNQLGAESRRTGR